MLVAVDDDRDHAAAGGGLDGQLRHFTLQALLHLLRLLHHVLNTHQRSLDGRLFDREYFEHGLDREFAIASAFTSSGALVGFLPATLELPAKPEPGRSGASVRTATVIGTGFPATFSAIDCSQAFCSSHWLFAFF